MKKIDTKTSYFGFLIKILYSTGQDNILHSDETSSFSVGGNPQKIKQLALLPISLVDRSLVFFSSIERVTLIFFTFNNFF